jgi:hypothetical protein
MNKFKFDLSFRIRHPQMDAEKICLQLGLKAKHKWTAGNQRKTPKGDLLEGTYDESYCSFPLDHDDEAELADLIRSSTQSLKPHEKFLQLISSTGGRLEYFIGWYSDGNSGEEFDADLINQLASLRIGLSFDFYGGK